jgi:tRNA threonylcarbamoyladenosine biosynthesis protein TsaB
MRVLALDTSTEGCSVALLTEHGIAGRFEDVGRAHAERILGMIDAVLNDGGLRLSALDGIAAGVGPGSFTGVRISVAVAQGLAFGAGVPVVPVTTLEALALKAIVNGAERVIACLDARMGEVYWGCFSADPAGLPAASSPLRVGPAANIAWPGADLYHGIGRGFAAYPQLTALPGLARDSLDSRALPDAREMARLGAARLAAGLGIDQADLMPMYVRDKVALTEAERAAAAVK